MKRLISALAVLITSSSLAYSQAKPTATRTGDLQIGGGFVYDFPDYSPNKFTGYGIYADLDFSEHFGVEAEFRQANDHTERIGGGGSIPQYQRTFDGGLRYHRTYKRLVPYAKALFGYGIEEYPPYAPPASQAISNGTAGYTFVAGGIGIDYVVAPHITVRAEMEYQSWFARVDQGLGRDSFTGTGGLPNGLTPILYTGGIAYRFGSGSYIPRGSRNGIH